MNLDGPSVCCSRFRSPDIQVIEHQCRRIWDDWDDYPVQSPPKKARSEIVMRELPEKQSPVQTDEKQIQTQIRKTKFEIDEMFARFRPRDQEPTSREPPATYNDPYIPTGTFKEHQKMPISPFIAYHRTESEPSARPSPLKQQPNPEELKITPAEILEARVLRKQNESLKLALAASLEKLENLKKENKRLLVEIETAEMQSTTNNLA